MPLNPHAWQRFDPPIDLPESDDAMLSVLGGKVVTWLDGSRRFEATVVSLVPETIDRATVWLALESQDTPETAAAGVVIPLSLLPGESSQLLEVQIPPDLAPGLLRIIPRVEVQRLAASTTPVRVDTITARTEGNHVLLTIVATLPEQVLGRTLAFHIEATNSQGDVEGRWRIDYQDTSAPQDQVVFSTELPGIVHAARLDWSATGLAVE